MSPAFELLAELAEVVDLAVEDDPDRLLGVGHRLMAAGQIDNRQSAKAEAERTRDVHALIVRPTVGDGPTHRHDVLGKDGSAAAEIELSADPAHGAQLRV